MVDGLLIFPEQEIIIEAEEDVDDDNADEQAQRQAPSYSVFWSCGPQPMWILGSCFCIIGISLMK